MLMCGLQKMPDFHKTYLNKSETQVASLEAIKADMQCNNCSAIPD